MNQVGQGIKLTSCLVFIATLLGTVCHAQPQITDAALISAGGGHTAVLRENGRVAAWGNNYYRQCEPPTNLYSVVGISAGGWNTAVLRSDGTVVVWGYNADGQCNVPDGMGEVAAISVGGEHIVALTDDGTVAAWGENSDGQCDVPEGLNTVTAISAGQHHTVAVRSDGTVVAWGENEYAQCDVPDDLDDVVAVSAGIKHTAALKQDGTVVMWGWNDEEQCDVPVGLNGVQAISAGGWHTVALKDDGTVVAWGKNDYGQCNVPPGLNDVVTVSAGGEHTVAVKPDGTLVAWGNNSHGQADIPLTLSNLVAVSSANSRHILALRENGTVVGWGTAGHENRCKVPDDVANVTAISAGFSQDFALQEDGTVVGWDSTGWKLNLPDEVSSGVAEISAGRQHQVALQVDGGVFAWGANRSGQCDVPEGLNNVVAVSAGGAHTVAVTEDGTAVAWGDNAARQCDVPDNLVNAVAVSAGEAHTVVLKEDGTVVAWGDNRSGQSDVPEDLRNVKEISAGKSHTVALRSDGTIAAWGSDAYGKCSVPRQWRDVIAVSAGEEHTVALKEDGTVVVAGIQYFVPEEDTEDGDADGLVDTWELQIVEADPNDPLVAVKDVLRNDDFDGDGATNAEEFTANTDPTDSHDAPLFGSRDLHGKWVVHALTTGDQPDFVGWFHGTATIDSSGDWLFESIYRSNGDDESSVERDFSLQVNGVGILTSRQDAAVHGVMTRNKKTCLMTNDDGGGGSNLIVMQRATTDLTLQELEGEWAIHGLVSGDTPDERPGWYHAALTIDDTGTASYTTPITDSLESPEFTPSRFNLQVDPTGELTLVSGRDVQWHGQVSADRNTWIAVATMTPGHPDGVRGYNMIIAQRKASAAKTSDLATCWRLTGSVSGDYSEGDLPGWYYGQIDINTDGDVVHAAPLVDSEETASHRPTLPPFSVDATGTITNVPDQDIRFHGQLGADRDLAVGVATMAPSHESGVRGYNLIFLTRHDTDNLLRVYAEGPYEVWGGDKPPENGYRIAWESGYRKIGEATGEATFGGRFPFYVLATRSVFWLDAIRLPGGFYAPDEKLDYFSGNSARWEVVLGAPDGVTSETGYTGSQWDNYTGYFGIENSAYDADFDVEYTACLPEGQDEFRSGQHEAEIAWWLELERFGEEPTAVESVCFSAPCPLEDIAVENAGTPQFEASGNVYTWRSVVLGEEEAEFSGKQTCGSISKMYPLSVTREWTPHVLNESGNVEVIVHVDIDPDGPAIENLDFSIGLVGMDDENAQSESDLGDPFATLTHVDVVVAGEGAYLDEHDDTDTIQWYELDVDDPAPGERYTLSATVHYELLPGVQSAVIEPVVGIDFGRPHDATAMAEWQNGQIALPTEGTVSISDPNLNGTEAVEWYIIEFHHQHRGLTDEITPELVVPALAQQTREVEPGQEITFDVTVENIGDGDAFVPNEPQREWDTVLYRSDDDQFDEDIDTEVAEFALTQLAAGASETRTLTFNAPAEPGTYYLAAKADVFNAVPESDEGNNWSEIIALEVSGPADEDDDEIPDEWEQQIVDADDADAIETVDDVLPEDDFDRDGRTNAAEYEQGTNPLGWLCLLDVAGAGDDYSQVGFGMHAGARDGEDDAYDVDVPMAPPEGEAAVYFESVRVSYLRDIRPIAGQAEWLLVVEAGDDADVALNWNAPQCLGETRHLSLFRVDEDLEPINGTFLNMKRAVELNVPAGESRQFLLRVGPALSVDIAFKTGWNLISLPFEPTGDNAVDGILDKSDTPARGRAMRDSTRGTIYTDAVWEWINEGADGAYRYGKAATLEAFKGYWAYADAPATATMEGSPAQDTRVELMLGWNLLGPACRMTVPTSQEADIRVRCWRWNANDQEYAQANEMLPCLGYWLNAGSDGVAVDVEPAAGSQQAPGTEARSSKTRSLSPQVLDDDLSDLVDGNTAFALDLYHSVNDEAGNLFLSPYSISVALGMTYGGARGETETQMADTLHFYLSQQNLHPAFNKLDLELESRGENAEGKDEKPFRLHIVNQLWGQKAYAFLPEFLDTLAVNYGAGLRLMDFMSAPESSRIQINDWVADQTEQRIKDLIPQGGIDTLTRLVLTNAIYFNAAWDSPFAKGNTTDGIFTQLDGTESTVSMMSQEQVYPYVDRETLKAVELPYDGHELSMVLLVPESGSFEDFEERLAPDELDQILGRLTGANLRLTMPKFEYSAELSLAQTLAAMGMPAALSTEANFSGMDGTRDLQISDVFHKAFVAVDEAGTEAVAATAVVAGTTSVPPEPVELTIDRPFIFLIRDIETGTILFLGRVVKVEGRSR